MRKRIIPYLKGGAVTAAVVLFLPLVTPQLNGQEFHHRPERRMDDHRADGH